MLAIFLFEIFITAGHLCLPHRYPRNILVGTSVNFISFSSLGGWSVVVGGEVGEIWQGRSLEDL